MRCLFYLLGCPFITILETVDYDSESNSLLFYEFGDSESRYKVLDISRENAKSIMKVLLRDGFYDFSFHTVIPADVDEVEITVHN